MARFQPALLGGLFIGVISSLPVIGQANACCCLWVVVGGLLTVYLQQQNRPTPVETAEAALGGLIAGIVGAIISSTALFVLMHGASGIGMEERIRAALDQNPQVPPELRDRIANMFSGPMLPVFIAVVTVPVYAVFGMLGAFLGLAFFRKKPAPPASPETGQTS